MGTAGDLLDINAEVCRELWRVVDIRGGQVGALTKHRQKIRTKPEVPCSIWGFGLLKTGLPKKMRPAAGAAFDLIRYFSIP